MAGNRNDPSGDQAGVKTRTAAFLVVAAALFATACGDDEGASSATTVPATEAPAATEAPSPTDAPATTEAMADTTMPESMTETTMAGMEGMAMAT